MTRSPASALTRIVAALALTSLLTAATAAAQAPSSVGETPAKVRELLDLLADPAVRAWIEERRAPGAPAVAAPAPEATPSGYAAARLAQIREHFGSLAQALPAVPVELAAAGRQLLAELERRGVVGVLLLIAAFAGLGFGAEWLYFRATGNIRDRISDNPMTTVRERLRAVITRSAFGLGLVLSFVAGSVGAFLVFEWPPLLKHIVLGYLLAFLALRLALIAGRFLLAPGGAKFRNVERFRIVPMDMAAARFWHRRWGWIVGWSAFGGVTVGLLGGLGVEVEVRRLVAYALGLVLLGIGLEIAWRRPRLIGTERRPARVGPWPLSACFVALWLAWVAGAGPLFWALAVAMALPAAIGASRRAVAHLLRPPGSAEAGEGPPSVAAVCLERGTELALVVAGVAVLAWSWSLDLAELTSRDTLATRLLRGAVNAVVIGLVAHFAWQVLKTAIDLKLADAHGPGEAEGEAAQRRARLRTLLPILRNVALVVLAAMAALMALAALGVEIGPLIAGAGVVGVAVGFGAQTLVRDVISGMFFLLDDAFRVGEYIQAGTYKGTVESFSLRSIKLRHHRGPLYTVPFGVLGAVQNMSRDWVIDKLTVGVTYDTDLALVKKLVKQVGRELGEDPELAPHILAPLKMQGVEQFGDFAIEIRMKITTKPGEQFVIRRRAYALLKQAFDKNGVKFAYPTVQVAGEGGATAAAARQVVERAKPVPPA